MAIALMWDNPNVTKEQYDAVRERIGVTDDNPPEGAIAHVAGEGPNGGWRVIEVWESKEAQEKFTREHLAPVFAEVGIERPEPQQWDVHRVMTR